MLVFCSALPFALLILLPLLALSAGLSDRTEDNLTRWSLLLTPLGGLGLAGHAYLNAHDLPQAAAGLLVGGVVFALGRSYEPSTRLAGELARLVLISAGIYLAAALDMRGIMGSVVLIALGLVYPRLAELIAEPPPAAAPAQQTPPPPPTPPPAPVVPAPFQAEHHPLQADPAPPVPTAPVAVPTAAHAAPVAARAASTVLPAIPASLPSPQTRPKPTFKASGPLPWQQPSPTEQDPPATNRPVSPEALQDVLDRPRTSRDD